jgi:Acyl-CoA dehydrogenase, N-terminal domain
MNNSSPLPTAQSVVARVNALVPWMQQRAGQLDEAAEFPIEEIAVLHDAGVLTVPLPSERVDSARAGPDLLNNVLTGLGRGNLAVGRIVEAHINARHLIARYGSPAQRARARAHVEDRHLFALWVTDPAEKALRITRMRDTGQSHFRIARATGQGSVRPSRPA